MKLRILIDKQQEEKILIYAHEKTPLIEEIERLIEDSVLGFTGYEEDSQFRLNPADIHCFTLEDGRLYALTDSGKLLIKMRLYQVEEKLSGNFVKINQSCIANVKKIARFDSSVTGTLRVIFKNGYEDYVSRRQIKSVKERLGL